MRDEPHTITVFRKFKGRWIARGVYKDKSLTVEDQTEDAALKRWRVTAEATAVLPPSE